MTVIEAANPKQLNAWADLIEANQWEGLFEGAIPAISQGVQVQFARAMSPAKVRWAPRKDNLPHPLLIKSGAMLAAAAWNGSGSVRAPTPNSITWGIDLAAIKYAGYQQFGTSRMPARPYLGLNDEQTEKVGNVINVGLVDQMNEAFR